MNWSDFVTARTSSGSVVPIRKHGNTSMAKDRANRAIVLISSESGDSTGNAGTRLLKRGNSSGMASAKTPIAAWTAP